MPVQIHGKERKVTINPVTGYGAIHNIGGRNGGHKYLHRIIAEEALGKPLPNKAEIHHIDGDRSNNTNDNLVICPNRAYHMMLHRRQRAFDATGNPNSVRCEYCGEYGADKERPNRPNRGWHYDCKRQYERAAYKRRKSNAC